MSKENKSRKKLDRIIKKARKAAKNAEEAARQAEISLLKIKDTRSKIKSDAQENQEKEPQALQTNGILHKETIYKGHQKRQDKKEAPKKRFLVRLFLQVSGDIFRHSNMNY